MESNIKITFWLNMTKKNSKNHVPIYLRVWCNYAYFTKSSGITVRIQDWDKKAMRVKGATPEAFATNNQLDSLKVKILQIISHLQLLGKPFNINNVKTSLEGNEASKITLMRVFEEHLKEMKKLLGKDYAPATITKYQNTHLRVKQFVKFQFKRSDIFLYELNAHFMSEFESFLKLKYENSTVTCYKHYQRLTCVLRKAMNKGYLEKFPFDSYRIRLPRKKIEYLTQDEINRIEQLTLPVERLSIIRDIFVFCIYTGLAYAELESITPDNITTGMDGDLWLNIHRKKTNKDYQVPLMQKPLELLEKYKNHPQCLKRGKCLPVPSNVKYNAYLKEVGDLADIPKDKPLVSHLARRSFACTIALANGMNINVLSKLLGHQSLMVTLNSYATAIDELMLRNVKELKSKLSQPSDKDEIKDLQVEQNEVINMVKRHRRG